MSNYAIYKLKYGYFRIEQEDGAVVSLRCLLEKPTEMGTPTTLTDTAANQLTEYFEGKRKAFDFFVSFARYGVSEKCLGRA